MAVFSFFAQFANLSAFAVVFWFDFEHYGRVKVRSSRCCACYSQNKRTSRPLRSRHSRYSKTDGHFRNRTEQIDIHKMRDKEMFLSSGT